MLTRRKGWFGQHVRAQLILLNLFCLVIIALCVCDDEEKAAGAAAARLAGDQHGAVADPSAPPLPLPLIENERAGKKINSPPPQPPPGGRSTKQPTVGRFPVFPFRTQTEMLDSTLQGKVKIIERKEQLPKSVERAKTAGTGTGRTKSGKKAAAEEDDRLGGLRKAAFNTTEEEQAEEVPQPQRTLPLPLPPEISSSALNSTATRLADAEPKKLQLPRGRSINFGTEESTSPDANSLPSSDQPFLQQRQQQDDKFRKSTGKAGTRGDDLGLGEVQTTAESSSIFGSGSSSSRSSSGGFGRRASSSSLFKSRSGSGGGGGGGGGSYGYRPSSSRPTTPARPTITTVIIPPTTSRPFLSRPPPTPPAPSLITGGGGQFEDYDEHEEEVIVPTFPAVGSSSAAGSIPAFPGVGGSTGGGGGGAGNSVIQGNSPTIVPILAGGGGGRTRNFGGGGGGGERAEDEEPEFLDMDILDDDVDDLGGGGGDPRDYEDKFPLASPLRSSILERTRGRAGRTRDKSVGGPVKPIRRLVGGVRTTSSSPSALLTSKVRLRELKGKVAASGAVTRGGSDDTDDIVRDFVFSDIKCFRTRSKEYFGATIYMKSDFHLPYIRDRPQDPLSSSFCRMEAMSAANTYHMTITDLRGCGVEQCGDQNMCLTMVFPKVPTLALADDEVTTIKCTPQKNSMSEIRSISFAGDSLDNRRSSSTVEGGTQEFAAEVGVFRQNSGSSNGLFVKRVNSGGVVKLGEPLQLRSVVRGGDGWTYSKLSDVKVWRMRDGYKHSFDRLNPNDASEVMTLVDARGCRNSEYKVIADSSPIRDPRNDLVHHFTFKAFLFRGQRSNEPLIVTAKVQACQELEGCSLDDCTTTVDPSSRELLEDESSDSPSSAATRIKRRSPVEIRNISSIVHDWSTQMALRVVGPGEEEEESLEGGQDFSNLDARGQDQYRLGEGRGSRVNGSGGGGGGGGGDGGCLGKMIGATFGGCFIMLLCCTLVMTLVMVCKKKRGRGRDEGGEFERSASFVSVGVPRPPHSGGGGNNRGENEAGGKSQVGHSMLKRLPTEPSVHSHNHSVLAHKRSSGFNSPHKPLPLPPIPKEDVEEMSDDGETASGSSSGCSSSLETRSSRSRSKSSTSKIGKLLAQLQLRAGGGGGGGEKKKEAAAVEVDEEELDLDGEEYECIPDQNNNNNNGRRKKEKENENVYIVYYNCGSKREKKGKAAAQLQHRSTSAPPSLRLRRGNKSRPATNTSTAVAKPHRRPPALDFDSTQEEEESEPPSSTAEEVAGLRRTVRAVKRSTRGQQSQSPGRGRGLAATHNNSILLGKGGSFPSRIQPAAVAHEQTRRHTKLGHRKSVNFEFGQEDEEEFTPGGGGGIESSSSDSAYSGSTSAASTRTVATTRAASTRADDNANDIFDKLRRSSRKTGPGTAAALGVGAQQGQVLLATAAPGGGVAQQQMTHFVTRNDSSTQIIIIPETNV